MSDWAPVRRAVETIGPWGAILAAAILCLTFLGASNATAATTGGGGCPFEDSTPLAAGEDRARAAMYCLINAERRRARRTRLTVNRQLEAEAAKFAAQMVSEQFFSHVDPQGNDLTQRTIASGYLNGFEVWALGENIGWGSGVLGTPKAMMNAMMDSRSHRSTILSRRYRNMGVGVSTGIPVGGRFGATYVQQFGWRSR